jgi:hypothetical protein
MHSRTFLTIFSLFVFGVSNNAVAQTCEIADQKEMRVIEGVPGGRAIITRFRNGVVHFRANMDVNTDGASNSYHPDDKNSTNNASNILCNGINVNVPKGWAGTNALVDFARKQQQDNAGAIGESVVVNGIGRLPNGMNKCPLLGQLYREARQAGWRTDAVTPRVVWKAMAFETRTGPNGQLADIPCIQKASDPSPGFFVSTTAFENADFAKYDVERYVDANRISNIVAPSLGFLQGRWNVNAGNLALVVQRSTGITVKTFVGDTGPSIRLGEGSVALVRKIQGSPASIARNIPYPIEYFILPGPRITQSSHDDSIARIVDVRMRDVGFDANACLALLPRN